MGATSDPDLNVVEFGRLQDVISARLDVGEHEFSVDELARQAEVTDAQVHAALTHLERKHEYVQSLGDGRYQIGGEMQE
jgi:DNA-binding IclR family transcriptional regulator